MSSKRTNSRLSLILLATVLTACGGGGGGSSDNAESPSTPATPDPVTVQLTIEGLIGESIDGTAAVTVSVGQQSYDAAVQGKVFTADISGAADDDLITVEARYPATATRKAIVLKSYVGSFAQADALDTSGKVSEAALPTLYVNALSTASAAFLERASGGEIASVDGLLSASQLLPQEMLLESAIGLRYIISGGSSDLYTQANTYALLQDYPAAAKVALELKTASAAGRTDYEGIRDDLINDTAQVTRVEGYSGEDLLFAIGSTQTERIAGFALNLSGGLSGSGHYVTSSSDYDSNSEVTYQISGNTTDLDLTAWNWLELYVPECETADVNDAENAQLTDVELTKYYDGAFYSAYQVSSVYACENIAKTFTRASGYYQLDSEHPASLENVVSGEFLINSYRNRKDEGLTSSTGFWEAAIVTPNANGTVDQRFDVASGFVDSGALSFNERGNLVIDTNRGDQIEYVTFGKDGAAVRVLGLLKRADGSLVSVAGEYAMPVVRGVQIPTPGDLFQAQSTFDLNDAAFPQYSAKFGLRYFADGTGLQVSNSVGTVTESTTADYSWSDTDLLREHHYYVDPTTYTTYSECPPGNTDCTEWRYREVEPVYYDGNYYYARVYWEFDYCKFDGTGTCKDVGGYISRWTAAAIQ